MRVLQSRSFWLAACGLGCYLGCRAMMARRRRYDFRNKVVVITGGSRGLGLLLARRFADEGARLALCARDASELSRAAEELRNRGADVLVHVCDLTKTEEISQFYSAVRSELGPVDVLVNNAGIIQVGPVEEMLQQDFEQAMAIHFWAALESIRQVLPDMSGRGGRIVNISSIGGKAAIPHLLPYCASKFALTGLSQGLRAELASKGIPVTTVCPGLMRTGSTRHALLKGRHRAEYAWFSIGGSMPLVSMNADLAACQIVDACRNGRAELTLTLPAKLLVCSNTLAPELTADSMCLVAHALPGPGGVSTRSVEGMRSTSSWSPSWLTVLNDRAAVRNNEIR